ncbi:hypothetical protein GGR57DRAFT_504985 [Xylariaceae sp. FL1272]|nr:hypothetical protein GGR57DRAFT_504985 [Xylariaceae sp. FL1272]
MAHLAPQDAIFSPSVARAAASTAKDWAYVDVWLRTKYSHLPTKERPPAFERNPDTLDALLALIAANEAADEDRRRMDRLHDTALVEIRAAEDDKSQRRARSHGPDKTSKPDLLAQDLLHAIDDGLTNEGRTALDAMADVAIALDTAADPSLATLAHRFVDLQGRAHQLDYTLHRVHLLQSHLDAESARLAALLHHLHNAPQYQLDPAISAQNRQLAQSVAETSACLPELKHQVDMLSTAVGTQALTVHDNKADEEAYLSLLARKKDLDAQVKAFAGLPPDIDAARHELDTLRSQLRHATDTRDANFEMLVERESPVKPAPSRRIQPGYMNLHIELLVGMGTAICFD